MKKVNYAIGLALLLWSSAFVGIRFSLTDYTPGSLALLRFLVASISITIIYALLPNKKKIPWPERLQLLLIGVGSIGIYNICLNIGELSVSAGIASFIIGINPVLTIIFCIILFKERTNFLVWFGVVTSMFGLLLIAMGGEYLEVRVQDVFIIFISTTMSAMYNLTQKYFLQKYHPVAVTCWVIWGGTLFLLYFLPALKQDLLTASFATTAVVVYMGIFSATLAYVFWCYALKKITASRASIYTYFLPLISTALGFLVLGEKPAPIALFGGIIALIGAIIAKQGHKNLMIPLKITHTN
ncbi:DMT family transporter [Legionella sp. D16C41]|uniref:DMT family transporter n=1 Tax=Legionella sp. D16C41 TaxID=3402688 RepID=UPI003AF88953